MSPRSSQCPKHPSHLAVGVCPSCLRECLGVLGNARVIANTDSSSSYPRQCASSSCSMVERAGTDSVISASDPFEVRTEIEKSSMPCKNSSRNGRSIVPFHEARVYKGSATANEAIVASRLSAPSPFPRTKNTLSSLFSLDDTASSTLEKDGVGKHCERKTNSKLLDIPIADCIRHWSSAAPQNVSRDRIGKNVPETSNKRNTKFDWLHNGSFPVAQSTFQAQIGVSERTGSKCGPFSETVGTKPSLAPLATGGKPFAWFSLLFFRRRKKFTSKSARTFSTFVENNGWKDARPSWEAPRSSSWEQFRLPCWEGYTTSWDAARSSWDGLIQTLDAESTLTGIDLFNKSMPVVRAGAKMECEGIQELMMGYGCRGWGSKSTTKSRKIERQIPSLTKQTMSEKSEPEHMIAKNPSADQSAFLSAKMVQWQRDVSTQTTPPRDSNATPRVIQKQQRHNHHQFRLPC